MKIVMFSDSYGSTTTTFIRNEINFLKVNHEVSYIAQEVNANNDGIKVFKVPYEEQFLVKKIRWFLWKKDRLCTFKNKNYAKRLNSALRLIKPDVIHCHFAYEAIKLLENIDEAFQVPIFVHFHGYGASQMLQKQSYVTRLKQLFEDKRINTFVVSNYIKENLKIHRIEIKQTHLLHCGIDLKLFNPNEEKKKNNKITFLQVSSLTEKKGHEYTLKAFHLFLNNHPIFKENIQLIFTGDGPNKEILSKLRDKLGLKKEVFFIGNVNSREAVRLMSISDIYVHHSITAKNGDQEGIPTSIMEAMAMKLPILSSFHSGIPELVEHDINGLLCNEKDIKTFSIQIEKILEWKKLKINRSKVENEFNLKTHNQTLLSYYWQQLYGFNKKNN